MSQFNIGDLVGAPYPKWGIWPEKVTSVKKNHLQVLFICRKLCENVLQMTSPAQLGNTYELGTMKQEIDLAINSYITANPPTNDTFAELFTYNSPENKVFTLYFNESCFNKMAGVKI